LRPDFVLPKALLDPGRVGKIAAAESECVGRASGSLFGGAAVLLGNGGCCAERDRQYREKTAAEYRDHVRSLL